jgi:hypothetical protein
MRAMIGCLNVFQVQLEFLMFDDMMFDDMLYPAIMQAMIPRHPCNCVLERDAVLLQSSVGFVSSDCFAAICGGLVPVPVRPPPKYYPDAAPHASSTCFCTGSGIYVQKLQQHLRFASVHGMSSPSRHFPGDLMRGPQQLQIIIVHWTCRHVY